MDGEAGRDGVSTRRGGRARGAAVPGAGADAEAIHGQTIHGESTCGESAHGGRNGAARSGGAEVDEGEEPCAETGASFPAGAGAAPPGHTDRSAGSGDHVRRRRGNAEPVVLDDISKRIVEELQVDGRRSYSALARTIGLSEAAVRQRVQHLLRAGVMQIVAVTDPLTLGFTRQALIAVRVEGDVRAVAAALVAVPEIDYVVMCAGAYDVLAEVVCEDDDHLLVILNETIRAIPGVRDTETFVYLRLAKQTYTWGTR